MAKMVYRCLCVGAAVDDDEDGNNGGDVDEKEKGGWSDTDVASIQYDHIAMISIYQSNIDMPSGEGRNDVQWQQP